ncbi:flagellar basal body P-ring formation chaperone FlgA [Niveibacterium sp. COAC-50]|uniref:flagellar basal body P-ring formation chaperone FlgA n=1 Tax=Niveibacterium sp. COAC-50 TaxID=2729384 RepID=UPI001551E821|nr:flagellar basal body P-ring formation chaperone FlgA [Niveibacterium sp. COAC-50]
MKRIIALALASATAHAAPSQVLLNASDASELRRLVARQAETWLAGERERYTVVGQTDEGAAQFDFAQPVRLTLFHPQGPNAVPTSVDVALEQALPATRSVRARLFLRRAVRGLVATRTLERNTSFRCEDYREGFVVVERAGAEPMSAPCVAPTQAMRLRNALSPGQTLHEADLRTAPLVAEGNDVPVRVQVASVVLEQHGRALRDAQPGERLSVQLANSTTPVTGRLRADGVVLIEGPSQ